MTPELKAQLIIAAVSAVAGWFVRWLKTHTDRLPAWARNWLTANQVSEADLTTAVEGFIGEAATYASSSPQARQAYAVAKLQSWMYLRTGVEIPTSLANLAVEWVYGRLRWKK
jgi:hypothetical protein